MFAKALCAVISYCNKCSEITIHMQFFIGYCFVGVFIATVQWFKVGQKMEPQSWTTHRTHFRHYEIPSIQLPVLLLSFLFLKICVYMHSHECIPVNMYVCLGLCICICMWTWGRSSGWHPMSSSRDYSFEPESLTELEALQLAQTFWPVSLILFRRPFQGWE